MRRGGTGAEAADQLTQEAVKVETLAAELGRLEGV